MQQVLGQNTSQTQQLCAKLLDIPVAEAQKIKTQKDKSKRIEITFTEEQFAKFEKVRDLLAHKNFQKKRTQNINDVLETMFDEILAEKAGSLENSVSVTECETEAEFESGWKFEVQSNGPVVGGLDVTLEMPSQARVTNTKWKALTPKRKQIVLGEDECCQYTDYETGHVCGSTFNLHVDHIIPKHVGGSNDPSNLRVLCREHNLYRQRQLTSELGSRTLNMN